MAITLDIKSELPTAIKWTNEHTKQLPFSISQAMNASVKGLAAIPGSKQKSALNALAVSASRFLDRPKPATASGSLNLKTSLGIEIVTCQATSLAANVRQNLTKLLLHLSQMVRYQQAHALCQQVQLSKTVTATSAKLTYAT
jgi:hypothetical protein